jgi:hypothetical protein
VQLEYVLPADSHRVSIGRSLRAKKGRKGPACSRKAPRSSQSSRSANGAALDIGRPAQCKGIGSGANSAHRYRRLAEKARRLQCDAAIPETRAGSSSALGNHESCCPEKRTKAAAGSSRQLYSACQPAVYRTDSAAADSATRRPRQAAGALTPFARARSRRSLTSWPDVCKCM